MTFSSFFPSFFFFSFFFYFSAYRVFWMNLLQITDRSSHRSCYIKKGALKNFANFKGKLLCQSLFLIKATRLWYRKFPVKFSKFLRTPFFTLHIPTTASALTMVLLLNKEAAKFCTKATIIVSKLYQKT